MSIGTEYKEYKIEYNETMDRWEMDIGSTTKSRGALLDAKQYIDTLEKKTKKFSPVSAHLKTFAQGKRFEPITITSEAWQPHGDLEVWIKDNRGRRRKVRAANVYLATHENKLAMEKMNSIENEISILEKKREELLGSMERYRSSEEGIRE